VSSSYVRETVRAWLSDASMSVPFYDTVNTDQNPMDDIWVTADFDSLFREKSTFCAGSWVEEGDITLVYTGLPGVGDGPLIAAAEADVSLLMAMRDPNDQLFLTNVSAANEYSGGSANQGYQIEFVVDYQFNEG
jgi:hypothetical protein